MSTICSAPVAAQDIAGRSWARELGATLNGWWVAYMTRRIEQAAIAQLMSMSDRELKDIGLVRSDMRRRVACAPSAHGL